MKKLKKLTMILLAAVMFVSVLAVPAFAGNLAYGAATVTASVLNIRSGPGTDYSRVGLVTKDSRLVVLEKTTDTWFKVNYNGVEGYVHSDYLKNVLKAENFNATGTLTSDTVRVRSGPSTDDSVLGTVSKGTTVPVIGINNGWYKVKTSDYTGYIRSDLMKITGAASSSAAPALTASSNASVGQKIADLAKSFVGYRYVYGEESPSKGFDCSGLVYYCYGQFGYKLERRASLQYAKHGTSVSKSELQAGDLVFFSSSGGGVTHVGIYLGDGDFVHASTSKTGVIISSLNSAYYTRVWYGAKRIV